MLGVLVLLAALFFLPFALLLLFFPPLPLEALRIRGRRRRVIRRFQLRPEAWVVGR